MAVADNLRLVADNGIRKTTPSGFSLLKVRCGERAKDLDTDRMCRAADVSRSSFRDRPDGFCGNFPLSRYVFCIISRSLFSSRWSEQLVRNFAKLCCGLELPHEESVNMGLPANSSKYRSSHVTDETSRAAGY